MSQNGKDKVGKEAEEGRMKRVRNRVLVLVVAVIGFLPIAFNVAAAVAPDVVQAPEVSHLENRPYAAGPALTVESVMDGSCQSQIDTYLSDHLPARDGATLFNAGWQRASIALGAASMGYDVYPTFYGSRYNVVPRDGIIVDRAEEQPTDDRALDAWVNTLNDAVRAHPDTRFVYDCVARHDQVEANPTYRYYGDRLNPEWVQENLIGRIDPRIDAFVDAVASYDEVRDEWYATDCHWTLRRALKSYDLVAQRLGLQTYPYENAVTGVGAWHGSYAHSGLDLDFPMRIEDLPIDFSSLEFHDLADDGGAQKQMGLRDRVLAGEAEVLPNGSSEYYEYFGGGSAEVVNRDGGNGKTMLFVGDSLSYCLERFLAANYDRAIFLLPGNSRYNQSFEEYLQRYQPDDVIVMMHASKYLMFAEYSPAFIGL